MFIVYVVYCTYTVYPLYIISIISHLFHFQSPIYSCTLCVRITQQCMQQYAVLDNYIYAVKKKVVRMCTAKAKARSRGYYHSRNPIFLPRTRKTVIIYIRDGIRLLFNISSSLHSPPHRMLYLCIFMIYEY